jgi:hypothetical protein
VFKVDWKNVQVEAGGGGLAGRSGYDDNLSGWNRSLDPALSPYLGIRWSGG